nr:hypothetical protein [Roseibium sp. RKSG952]
MLLRQDLHVCADPGQQPLRKGTGNLDLCPEADGSPVRCNRLKQDRIFNSASAFAFDSADLPDRGGIEIAMHQRERFLSGGRLWHRIRLWNRCQARSVIGQILLIGLLRGFGNGHRNRLSHHRPGDPYQPGCKEPKDHILAHETILKETAMSLPVPS